MGSIGAPLTMDFIVHFEAGAGLRVGEKRQIGSTGSTQDGGIELHYYEYEVYCDRTVLVGSVLQTAIMKDMGPATNEPEWFRPGGLCSMLTLSIHPGLAVEYRGRSIPVQTAQNMQIGQLLDDSYEYSSQYKVHRFRLIGKMDVCACLPCCCFLPKLLDPNMLPWNQYDIYDPDYDFTFVGASQSKPVCEGPLPSAPPEKMDRGQKSKPRKSAMKSNPRYGTSKSDSHASKKSSSFNASRESANAAAAMSSREEDIAALKKLKSSGVLSNSEFVSKVNQVNVKYDGEMKSELDAIAKLHEDGILTAAEYKTKRDIIMKLHQ